MTSRQKLVFSAIELVTYVELADEFASKPEPPAKRTAADRAYFAAFLTSRDQLTTKGYITPYYDQQGHEYVTESLKREDLLGAFGNEEYRLRVAQTA